MNYAMTVYTFTSRPGCIPYSARVGAVVVCGQGLAHTCPLTLNCLGKHALGMPYNIMNTGILMFRCEDGFDPSIEQRLRLHQLLAATIPSK